MRQPIRIRRGLFPEGSAEPVRSETTFRSSSQVHIRYQKSHSQFSWKKQKKSYTLGTVLSSVDLAVSTTNSLMPSQDVLCLHDQHEIFSSFEEFEPRLVPFLRQGKVLEQCEQVIRRVGILEPFTGEHISPQQIQVSGPNYRESLIAHGLLSRNRAILKVVEDWCGSLDALRQQHIFLPESLSGFAMWLKRFVDQKRLVTSEYLDNDQERNPLDIMHQDLCSLTFGDESFDLVLCSELLEHVYSLELALQETLRVLKPGGRLVATFPMAFGQCSSIEKARWNNSSGEVELLADADFHGDPLRPQEGALVYRIPGWEVLMQARTAGFTKAVMHAIASWKHGVLGGDLACVLVLEAQR
jgi:SAM-dependent methyltransferase